jgi:hypothetical protein
LNSIQKSIRKWRKETVLMGLLWSKVHNTWVGLGLASRPSLSTFGSPRRRGRGQCAVTMPGRGQRAWHGAALSSSSAAQSRNRHRGNRLGNTTIAPLHQNLLKTTGKRVLTGGVVGAAAHRRRRGRRMASGRRWGRRQGPSAAGARGGR